MVKASNNETSKNLNITAILSFSFKRKLPELARVIEGTREQDIILKDSNYSIFSNMSKMNECGGDPNKRFEFQLTHFLP